MKIIQILIGLAAILFIKIYSLFNQIQIGKVVGSRIGSILIFPEIHILESKKFNTKKIKFLWVEKPICNQYCLRLLKKEFTIIPEVIVRPAFIICRKLNILKHIFIEDITKNGDRDVDSLLDKYPQQIKLSKNELAIGQKKLLEKFKIKNKKFICLIIRDSAYLDKKFPDKNWNYHDYRNGDIDRQYKHLVRFFIGKGYTVFRMGNLANKKLNLKDKSFIDYPFSKHKSDFFDVYIGLNCEFCITNSTGFDTLPFLARKKLLFLNYAPIGYSWTFSKRVMLSFKWHYDVKNKTYLNLNKIFKTDVYKSLTTQEFVNKSIKVTEINKEEILLLCNEFYGFYLNNKKILNSKKQINSKKYFRQLLLKSKLKSIHGKSFNAYLAISHFRKKKLENFFLK